jgi:hypothetical protein
MSHRLLLKYFDFLLENKFLSQKRMKISSLGCFIVWIIETRIESNIIGSLTHFMQNKY